MSNMDVQDEYGGAQHSLGESSNAGSVVKRRGLRSAQVYGTSIFDLGSSQLRKTKASLGVSTNATLASWLLVPASGCPNLP